ncbi:MAG: type II secretion system protein [Planctomycetota bacterium]|nr:type II secretion system protein [Planctomycetota bacterium]
MRRAFSLIELLVVVAIIGVLLGILLPVLGKARQCVLITGELSAGRQFAAGLAMYSNDYDGAVMPGFASASMVASGTVVATNDRGSRLAGLEAQRYPWRLMPFIENEIDLLYRDRRLMQEQLAGATYDYAASVGPRFGMNQAFVGGSGDADGTGFAFHSSPAIRARTEARWPRGWFLSRVADTARPADLIAFASASGASPINGLAIDGFYRVTPPSFIRRMWSTSKPNESSPPTATGNVSFRFAGRTVGAMLDGHAQTLSWEEAQDMRRWAPRADSPSWTLPPL